MTIDDLPVAYLLKMVLIVAGFGLFVVLAKMAEQKLTPRRPRRPPNGSTKSYRAMSGPTGRPPESPFEHRLLGLIDGAGLAPPEPQYLVPARGHQYRADFAYPSLNLAVEVDGAFHNSSSRRDGDRARDEALAEIGWSTLRLTTTEIARSPMVVVGKLREHGVPPAGG